MTRSDCLFGTKRALEKSKEQISHRAPYGCLYNGYQNPYVQWTVNYIVAPDAFRCIARFPNMGGQAGGVLYAPVLQITPEGDDWYCYLNR